MKERPAAGAGPSSNRSRRSIALLIVGDGISTAGDWVLNTAASMAVFSSTGSTAAVSLLLALAIVPTIVLGPVSGALADRYDRKTVLILADCASAGLLFAAAGLVRLGSGTGVVFAAVLLLACVSAVRRPAGEALRPALAGDDSIGRANALAQAASRLAMIGGPGVAAILMASGGLQLALTSDALSFVVCAVLVAGVHRPPQAVAAAASSPFRAAAEGLRFVQSRPAIRNIVITVGVVMLAAPVVNAGTLALVRDEIGAPESRYGLLLSIEGVGAMAAALTLAWLGRRVPMLATGVACVVLSGVATVATGWAPGLEVAATAMAVLGVGVVGFQVGLASSLQIRTPDGYRGRVMGLVAMTASLASLAGFALAGPLVSVAGVRPAFAASGLMIILAAAPLALRTSRQSEEPAAAFAETPSA